MAIAWLPIGAVAERAEVGSDIIVAVSCMFFVLLDAEIDQFCILIKP